MFKLLLFSGMLLFTFEHPLLVALYSVIYFINCNLEKEEMNKLKEVASKGTLWLKELNKTSKEAGFSMKEGREITSEVMSSLFKNIDKETLTKFMSNEKLADKFSKFVVEEVNNEETNSINWEAFPLEESDLLEEEEKELISYIVPSFDWSNPYTEKEHRQLFKKLKAHFRDYDGSINDEVGNKLIIELEEWIYCFMTQSEFPGQYAMDEDIINYYINKNYKNHEEKV